MPRDDRWAEAFEAAIELKYRLVDLEEEVQRALQDIIDYLKECV